MSKLLWEPSEETKNKANMTKFIGLVNKKHGRDIKSYNELYNWSITEIPEFWATIWDFIPIKASKAYIEVVDDLSKFHGARWFKGARLNLAENLLRHRDKHTALIFRGETREKASLTYNQLYTEVTRVAESLRGMGVKPGDRVGAYMPNLI